MNDSYRLLHDACPRCGKKAFQENKLSRLVDGRDLNLAVCVDDGCKSWSGLVDELVPLVKPRRTCPAKAATLLGDVVTSFAEPGSYELRGNLLLLACPGCGKVSGMTVGNPKPKETPSWLIEIVKGKLNLHPSVNCVGCCTWHGWVKDSVCKPV